MTESNAGVSREVLVDCASVWKVFGARSDEAMRAVIDDGLSKKQVLETFNCVVGVADVTLSLHRGEILCVMGLSGSGKSTLVRLLNRLIDPSHGRVTVNGSDLSTLNAAGLRKIRSEHIGMVFQNVALLPNRTVLDNTAFGLEARGVPRANRRETARQALARVNLAGWEDHLPHELSGGMQQRVGLARAITADPEIILMDEPFSALDPLIRRQLQTEFRGLIKELGKSAVFITHDLNEAVRMGDRVVIMRDGRVVQVGTAEEIVRDPADDYVADFVADVPRLNLIRAHSIMEDAGVWQNHHDGEDLARLPVAAPDADLETLIDILSSSEGHAIAIRKDDQLLGVVSMRTLMGAVKAPDRAQAEAA